MIEPYSASVSRRRHSARSWLDPALPDDYRDIAALLSTSPQKVREALVPQGAVASEATGVTLDSQGAVERV